MNVKCDKYEWNFNESTGRLTCERHGEEWRDDTGDGAVLSLLQVAYELQEKMKALTTHAADIDTVRTFVRKSFGQECYPTLSYAISAQADALAALDRLEGI